MVLWRIYHSGFRTALLRKFPSGLYKGDLSPRFFTAAEDGLSQTWPGKVFMNPPYGREIGKWVRKAWEESQKGALVVCLLPARVDTRWWHDYARRGYVYFIRGRVKFGDARNCAPFPSAIVAFGRFFSR